MTESKEKEILIANLKGTNRSLLRRMIVILTFAIIGLGFYFTQWSGLRKAQELVKDEYLIEELRGKQALKSIYLVYRFFSRMSISLIGQK